MKKIIPMVIVAILLLSGIGAVALDSDVKEIKNSEKGNREFTHAVLAEYGTATWCGYCHYAHSALKNIYASGDFPFYYVSFVRDKNPTVVDPRLFTELNLYGYPTVYFDGGSSVYVGGGTGNEAAYRNILNIEANRVVYDVDIELSVTWLGGTEMQIDCSVINNEADTYDGTVRVYITEIISSMGWYDTSGQLYTFPLLDFAFDADGTGEIVSIASGGSWTGSTTWDGTAHGFGSITDDNIMVIAAIFNDEAHGAYAYPPNQNPFDAYYVDDTVGAVPAGGENNPPETPTLDGPTEGTAGEEYSYEVCSTDPDGDDLIYCIDFGDDTGEVCVGPFPSGTCAIINHTWAEEGTYTVKAKATDTEGAESDWATLEVVMPVNKQVSNSLLQMILERFPKAFPVLRLLLGL